MQRDIREQFFVLYFPSPSFLHKVRQPEGGRGAADIVFPFFVPPLLLNDGFSAG